MIHWTDEAQRFKNNTNQKMIMPEKKKRMHSPSSINTYKQCPRKYYYNYIEKLPTTANIHQLRGTIVHKALENFYEISLIDLAELEKFDITQINQHFQRFIIQLFYEEWKRKLPELQALPLEKPQLQFYYDESIAMLSLWLREYMKSLKTALTGKTLIQAFENLRPQREQQYKNEQLNVKGFIDAIFKDGKEITLLDYKTSKNPEITEEIKLQLAIYALLYFETHRTLPTKVGAFFLKHGEKFLHVDDELLQLAKLECEIMELNTQSSEKTDYPKKISRLCKYSTGQCDFFGTCFKNESYPFG